MYLKIGSSAGVQHSIELQIMEKHFQKVAAVHAMDKPESTSTC